MKNSLSNSGTKRGFTMVEILVVISIIALLAAISLPVLGRIREGGRRTACNSNLRQMGLAFTQYTNDNGGRFPFAANYQDWQRDAAWVKGGAGGLVTNDPLITGAFDYVDGRAAYPEKGSLFPYVKDARIYVCPSDDLGSKKKLSYSMNCALSFMGTVRIKQPADIVLLIDEQQSLNDGYFWATNDPDSTDALTQKHNGGGNLLFADGHVKFYPYNSFVIDKSPAGLINKFRTDGSPRFHDKAFGPKGSYYKIGQTVDVCGTTL